MNGTPDTLISESVVLDALKEVEDMIKLHADTDGDEDRKVKLGRWISARMRKGLEQAREHYLTIPAAARASGWHEQTLRSYCRRSVQGEKLPPPWHRLQVQGGHGSLYAVLVSTIPPHPGD